jgi:uncharacterized protein (TIGR03437 family)
MQDAHASHNRSDCCLHRRGLGADWQYRCYGGCRVSEGSAVAWISIASLFCAGLTGISGIVAADRYPLPLGLAGVRVKVGGAQAPLFAVAQLAGYQQINLQVPWEAAFADETDVVVEQGGQQTTARLPRVTTIASFFRLPDGSGAFQHAADYSLVSAANPGRAGETVTGYLTSLIGTAPAVPRVPTGQPAPADPPVSLSVVLRGTSRQRFEILGRRSAESQGSVTFVLRVCPRPCWRVPSELHGAGRFARGSSACEVG